MLLLIILFNSLPFLLILGIAFFALRQVQKGGGAGGAMGFGKSKAKLLTERQGRVTFDDVAGIDEAREELEGRVREAESALEASQADAAKHASAKEQAVEKLRELVGRFKAQGEALKAAQAAAGASDSEAAQARAERQELDAAMAEKDRALTPNPNP